MRQKNKGIMYPDFQQSYKTTANKTGWSWNRNVDYNAIDDSQHMETIIEE